MDEPRICNRLHVLRAERGLSRQDLANALDIHYQTAGCPEHGGRTRAWRSPFASATTFELPIDEIFSPRPFKPRSVEAHDEGGVREGRRSQ